MADDRAEHRRPVRRWMTVGRAAPLVAVAIAAGIGLVGCAGDRDERGVGGDLIGAGATFPFPLYARWFDAYARERDVRINYQSVGSGGGIRQLLAGTVDFGASDVPMTDEELARVPRGEVVHVPTVLGAVAITYNLPGVTDTLRLTGDVLADLFLGRIERWNDARVAVLNPGVPLPDRDVLVAHRSDGSGTSYIVSDYLSAVSPDWAAGPGRGKDVRWPVGLGGKGNEGVAGQIKQLPGSIGYVETTYARQNDLPVARIRNAAGNFVAPAPREVAAAATAVLDAVDASADLRLSIVNAPGAEAYPIASFTWILLAPELVGPDKTAGMVRFLRWAFVDGREAAVALGYEPLPDPLVERIVARLARLDADTVGGT